MLDEKSCAFFTLQIRSGPKKKVVFTANAIRREGKP